MKIISRKELMELPEGVIYMSYSPVVFGDLMIKGETINDGEENIDWYESSLFYEPLGPKDGNDFTIDETRSSDRVFDIIDVQMGEQGISMRMDFEVYSREGYFDNDMQYAILEQHDVEDLISKLRKDGYYKI